MDDRSLLFFVKSPEHGSVKTRLSKTIGEEAAKDLYKNFIHDMLSSLEKENYPFFICVYPDYASEGLKKKFGEKHQYISQKGKNLGQRMEHGFRNAFSMGFRRVIIIGSDVPDLPVDTVVDAFKFLCTVDCVIGPSFDGGYYLIGFHRSSFLPETFKGIEWGTDMVLKKTIDILKRHRLTTHILRTWLDIDTIEDLRQFFEKNKNTSFCHRTMAYLQTLKMPYLKDIKEK